MTKIFINFEIQSTLKKNSMNTSSSSHSKKIKLRKWTLKGALISPLIIIILSLLMADPAMRIVLVLTLASIAGMFTTRFIYAIKTNSKFWRRIGLGILSFFSLLIVFLAIKWKHISDKGGQIRQEPFCIAGNLYYVGTKEVTSFLLTSSEGHILIDGGYPGTADMIIKNIEILGHKITDVKILLNSHAHLDHAGGLSALQKASGAELWISEADAELIASGGSGKRNLGLMNFLVYIGMAKFPIPHIHHKFKDGTKITLDSIELTAHITPGHTPGCTTWAIPLKENGQELLAVSIGSLTLIPSSLFGEKYDEQLQNEFNHSFEVLRNLPADIFLGSHASFFNMKEKLKQRDTSLNKVAPFVDKEGYLKYIKDAEKELKKALEKQQ